MAHSKAFILSVWRKGRIVSGETGLIWRKDDCGAWIKFTDYGNRSSQFGWEIDRIKTGLKGGDYVLSNCRPLQWENNLSKSGGNLVCKVKARRASVRKGNIKI